MRQDDWRNGRALRRIAMLLLALAGLAERAAAMSGARRAAVLAILRPAEAAAWAFALGAPVVPAAVEGDRGGREPGRLASPTGGDNGPDELARMAAGLRMLALFVARWVADALSSRAGPFPAGRCALRLAAPAASWRGPAAVPAPDTS